MRDCTRCNGTGRGYDGDCYACKGKRKFPAPNAQKLIRNLLVTRGPRKGRMKKGAPYRPRERVKDLEKRRTYYLWRMARWHGGADVTMPIMAETENAGDPYTDYLDHLAGIIARTEFGTEMAAAYRWGALLGYTDGTPEGLPDTAYQGGPVADRNKPLEELAELIDPAE